ncbi:hypothetical protein VNI00_003247 [Paramarasmius palmivorus]|uniref:Uncharacterized protein n=1 Tax=Paramarasmius palmivorus TaxID=297713 RepID=A0AAW0DSI4_9AGAR
MDGKPLYEYARKGIPLPRPIEPRSVTVHSLKLEEWLGNDHSFKWPEKSLSEEEKKAVEKAIQGVDEGASIKDEPEVISGDEVPTAFVLSMKVSGGTYVRSIVHDLAHALGSAGHVVTLTRSRQGRFVLGEPEEENDRRCLSWDIFEKAFAESAEAERDEEGLTAWERELFWNTYPPNTHSEMAANGVNGVHAINGRGSRVLKAGIYAPIPTFFLENEDLDVESFQKHVLRVTSAGVGPLIAGSMGEALHLSHSERVTLIKAARRTLDANGFPEVPLIVGTGAGSTRETLELTVEAANAGADFAIVITSGYFSGALANNKKALKDFFREVSEKSPIPIMIYNYPGASGGIDLDSDLITELATECANTCGVKLTCGNVGKTHAPFLVLGGFIDFLTPSTYANAHGAITGLGNVAPHAIAELFRLSEAARKDLSQLQEAQRLQGIIARADYTIAKASIAGTKYLLEKLYGYGGAPRRPLPPIEPSAGQALWEHPHTQDLVKLEREISGKSK